MWIWLSLFSFCGTLLLSPYHGELYFPRVGFTGYELKTKKINILFKSNFSYINLALWLTLSCSLPAYQSWSKDHISGEHTRWSSSEEARHHKSKRIVRLGTKDQAARWSSSHGGRFPTEAWSSQKELNQVNLSVAAIHAQLLGSLTPPGSHFSFYPIILWFWINSWNFYNWKEPIAWCVELINSCCSVKDYGIIQGN